MDPYTLADSTSIRSTSYAFDFLSTTVGFHCSHSNDSCDNQIWRNHCNQEVIALAVHPQNLGRDLRLRWKENDDLSLALSGHRAAEQKHPTLGAQGPALQGTANWRKVLLPPGLGRSAGHAAGLSGLLHFYPLGAQCSVFLALMSNTFIHMLLKLESGLF